MIHQGDGIHPKALKKIIDYGVNQMVYISCKPTSLARDLQELIANGYKVKRMAFVDMFVGTVHCETVCLLSNRKPDTTVKLSEDMEDYYRIKDGKDEE